MADFDRKKNKKNDNFHKTLPIPAECSSCHYEFTDDEKSRKQVNFLSCRDKNKGGKISTGTPSKFMQLDAHGNYQGDSASGYVLKDNYDCVRWTVWCDKCHAAKSRLQDMNRKTNNMIPDGNNSQPIEKQLNKLGLLLE